MKIGFIFIPFIYFKWLSILVSTFHQAELLKLKLDRAAMLVDGLSDERIRWENTVASLAEFFDWLPGDCLISTAFVSYLGPFVSSYREELINIWMQEVRSESKWNTFGFPRVINCQSKLIRWSIRKSQCRLIFSWRNSWPTRRWSGIGTCKAYPRTISVRRTVS